MMDSSGVYKHHYNDKIQADSGNNPTK